MALIHLKVSSGPVQEVNRIQFVVVFIYNLRISQNSCQTHCRDNELMSELRDMSVWNEQTLDRWMWLHLPKSSEILCLNLCIAMSHM
jgi:hypothetical protein